MSSAQVRFAIPNTVEMFSGMNVLILVYDTLEATVQMVHHPPVSFLDEPNSSYFFVSNGNFSRCGA